MPVEYFENLVGVCFCVLRNLFAGERLASDGAARGVTDQRGEVANEKDDLVAQILKMLELSHQHGVAQMQIGCGGIEARLDANGLAAFRGSLQALLQI